MPNATLTKRFWERVDGALVRTAARRAGAIRNGLLASIDATQIAEAFVNDFHEGTTVDKAFVKAWAKSHIKPDNTQLSKALDQVWGDGYHLGRVAGLAAIGFVRVRKDAATDKQINDALNVDWSTWIPGNAGAAYIAHPKGSLGRLLNKKASTLKNLDDTSVERIGTLLSDALLEGLAPADLARRIIDDVGNSVSSASRALTIATTEMNGAMSIASMDTYEENGIELVEWVGLDACDICEPNIEASPIPRGQEFPSGDTEPEAHPNCRCSISPFIDWGDGGSPFGAGVYDDIQQGIYEDIMGDGIDLAVKPGLKVEPMLGVPGPLEAERALSRLAILPNPADAGLDEPEKYVESPWEVVVPPTVDPNVWDNAVKTLVNLDELFGTDPFLKRKRVRKHIEAMGQALTEFRSYPLVVVYKGNTIILDGHHRLMSIWLLGQETAAVWKVKI
jgi:hypothetical protein